MCKSDMFCYDLKSTSKFAYIRNLRKVTSEQNTDYQFQELEECQQAQFLCTILVSNNYYYHYHYDYHYHYCQYFSNFTIITN